MPMRVQRAVRPGRDMQSPKLAGAGRLSRPLLQALQLGCAPGSWGVELLDPLSQSHSLDMSHMALLRRQRDRRLWPALPLADESR